MAQTYVGSGNNINLLQPNGQFGTRLMGGKDHASARYIFTVLTPAARAVFRPEDNAILDYLEDDGDKCEPTYYVPIIPFVLCNGANGIGTGFSTTVTCFNPADLIVMCVGLIDALTEAGVRLEAEEDMAKAYPIVEKFRVGKLDPWFKGFTGRIEDGKSYGVVRRMAVPEPGGKGGKGGKASAAEVAAAAASVEITELPIGTWTEDFKSQLEDPEWAGNKRGLVRDFKSHYTETVVSFQVRLTPDGEALMAEEDKLIDLFKLSSSKMLGVGNMHLYSAERHIEKYDNTTQIFKAYAKVRLLTYIKRKAADVKAMAQELRVLDARARFISDVCDGSIKVMNTPAKTVATQLKGAKPPYPTLKEEEVAGGTSTKPSKDDDASTDDGNEEDSNESDEHQAGGASAKGGKAGASTAVAAAEAAEVAADAEVKGYAYLLGMPIGTLTKEKRMRLEIESAALRKRLEELRKTPIIEIWRRELGDLSRLL